MEWAAAIWQGIPIIWLIFLRVAGVLFSMPLVGARNVPIPFKIGFALAFSVALVPLLHLEGMSMPQDLVVFVSLCIREVLIGLAMGFLVHVIFGAVQIAGQVIGYQMGFAIANVMDPLEQRESSVTAHFMNLMAICLFMILNVHHLLIASIVKSYEIVPPTGAVFRGELKDFVIPMGRHLFSSALMLAAPVMVILIFLQMAMAIIARTVPQMNVFLLAFPLQIGVGLIAMGGALGLSLPWLSNLLMGLRTEIYWLLKAL